MGWGFKRKAGLHRDPGAESPDQRSPVSAGGPTPRAVRHCVWVGGSASEAALAWPCCELCVKLKHCRENVAEVFRDWGKEGNTRAPPETAPRRARVRNRFTRN